MSNYKDQFGSTLKAEDLIGKGLVRVVIERVAVEELKSDKGNEKKLIARFVGKDKGLVLNRTNADALAELAGTDDYDNWGGTPVILFIDPSVMFGGKRVGGIRVRGVNGPTQTRVELPPERPHTTEPEPSIDLNDDDIPFMWLMPLLLPALGIIGSLTVLV